MAKRKRKEIRGALRGALLSSARPQARAAEFWSWGLGGIARGKTVRRSLE